MAIVEDREPGAIVLDDEPFDVVRANSSIDDSYGRSPSNTAKSMNANSARYDVGDLPTLSRNPGPSSESSTVDVHAVSQTLSKTTDLTRNVTGGRSSRTRPLSPPSRAGLDDPEVYQRKQQQSKASDDSEAYSAEETGATRSTLSRGRSYNSEMPMDERQEYEDDMKALALCDYGDSSQGVPEFCETAMTAVNEMCAGGLAGGDTSPNRVVYDGDGEEAFSSSKKARALAIAKAKRPSLKLGEKHSPSKGVEEQTAIEVEYVEPLYRGRTGSGESDRYSSPKRKNALLKAMTRKARDDWKGKGKKGKPQSTTEDEGEPTSEADNVYASFSNSEKRKFLQLINGGSTPFDATSRVLKERMEPGGQQKDGVSVADSSFQSEDHTPNSKTKKSRKLAFWKRKGKEKETAPSLRGDPPTGPPSDPGSPPVSPPTSPPRGVYSNSPPHGNDEIYEDNDDDEGVSDGGSSCENVGDEIKQFLREEAASIASSKKSPAREPSRSADDGDQRFEKSGISYYDAVRKDVSMEDDEAYYDDGEYADETSRRQPRKIKMPRGIKGGFSKFRERNRAMPVPEDDDDNKGRATSKNATEAQPSDPRSSFDEEKKAEEDPRAKAAVAVAIAGTAGVAAAAVMSEDTAGDAAGDTAGDAMEDAMTAKLLGGLVSQQMPDVEDEDEQPQGPSPEEIVDDLNMDAYLGSTETMSRTGLGTGASGSFDATSVVSGRSYKTSGTNYSTRSIRPGQGKVRLKQEKSILNTSTSSTKTRGWQESIEAAAARTGKSWDRENGWKDYVDPTRLEVKTGEFYTESVDVGVEEEAERELPSDPAQLAEWRDSKRSPKSQEATSVATTPSRKSKFPSRKKHSPQRKVATTPKDERPRGWAATMKAATAKLNMQGKRWDPEKGWMGLSQEEAMSVSDGKRESSNDVNIVADSDMQDFGTLGTVEQLDQIANKQDKSLQFLSEDEDAENNPRSLGEEENDGDLSSSAGKSKNSGRYIQIAPTGSVREFERQRSQNINVKKQNLNQHESDFFPEGSHHNVKKGPVDLDDIYEREQKYDATLPDKMEKLKIHSGPNANSMYQKIYESNSNGSFDDGAATDFSYDEADQATEIGKNTENRKAVPRLKIKIRDVASVASSLPSSSAKSTGNPQSEASFESSSSIPKLAAPRRDTSPIRGNKAKTSTPTSERSRTGEPASERFATTPVMISPSQDNDDIRNEIRYEEPRSHRIDEPGMPPVKETIDSPVYVRERVTPTGSPMTPSKMSQLHHMWEKRTKSWDERESPILTSEEITAQSENSEWKQFLVKKVQAESAAANNVSPRELRQDGRDNILDFSGDSNQIDPKNSGTFDNISELSPIRHNLSDSDFTGATASEASTSVIQGTTFLQRLQACAAPIVTKGSQFAQSQNCNSESGPISAHLAFLRANPGVGGSPDKKAALMQATAGLCGRPDVIVEDEEDETIFEDGSRTTAQSSRHGSVSPSQKERSRSSPRSRQHNKYDLKERSRSNPRSRQHNKDDLSSVVSEGFGAKSAYLEALAMKAAVSGGSKKKKKKRSEGSEVSAYTDISQSRQSPGSEASAAASGTSKHSDKFQQFLDRRASKEASASNQQASKSPEQLRDERPPRSEVSNRAEQYASEKVNEMMDSMAGRAKEDYEETGAFPTLPNAPANNPANDAARIAAEELAAARVEVMMQRLSSQNLEDHEAEI